MCPLHLLMWYALGMLMGDCVVHLLPEDSAQNCWAALWMRTRSNLALDHCTAPHASALAPVPRMTLALFAQQVDHYFLNYPWHLTQIQNICGASCNLPMAKANRPFLALQWSSPTTCCPYLLIKYSLLVCMSALSGVQAALMNQALHVPPVSLGSVIYPSEMPLSILME